MKGKEVAIFYDDGQSVVRKDGVLEREDNGWIYLTINDKSISIPKSRVIRIEYKDSVNHV